MNKVVHRTSHRRRYQFQLRELLLATTGVAAACGLTTWLGWDVIPLTVIFGGPVVTLLHLTRTRGMRPGRSLAAGGLVLAMAMFFIGLLVSVAGILATIGTPSAHSLYPLGYIFLPILLLVAGELAGIVLSLPLLVMWYLGRRAWCRWKRSRQPKCPVAFDALE